METNILLPVVIGFHKTNREHKWKISLVLSELTIVIEFMLALKRSKKVGLLVAQSITATRESRNLSTVKLPILAQLHILK